MMLTAAVLHSPPQITANMPGSLSMPQRGVAGHLEHLREYGMRLRFQRNEAIFHAGESAAHVYRVASGSIRLCRHMADGRRSISNFLLTADVFGLGDFREFPYTAEAVVPATIIAYPAALFDQLRESSPELQSELMAHYLALLARAEQHLFVTSCQTARERVASFIMEMSGRFELVYGSRIDLPMGRQDIADYLGLTIETICRSLASLKKAGMIAIPNAHQVEIVDMRALRALADGRHTQ